MRPRLETMRHWTTSFQLLNRDSENRGWRAGLKVASLAWRLESAADAG